MKRFLLPSIFAAMLFAGPAVAADIATKAQPVPFLTGYPYGTSGLYAGLFTEGGAGPVVASAPGVNPASLTTTTAGIGVDVGYAWGSKASPLAYALEGKVSANNFNGANAGFSVSGPVSFEVTGLVWMPVSLIQNAFSALNIPNLFGSIAPFPTLAGNVTASNVQAGFGAGLRGDDVTIAYLGVGSNKVFDFSPKIEFDLMEQLSNGSALREYTEMIFQGQGHVLGAQQVKGTLGNKYMAGVMYNF
jgi:hypothetical protein